MLDVHGLEVWYGAAPALWGVSLTMRAGELLSVVGPNGAGKTTLINALCGIERARAGRIVVDGVDVTRLPSHRFCAAGIAIVPEGRRLFIAMTVRENLELGSHLPRARAERAESLAADRRRHVRCGSPHQRPGRLGAPRRAERRGGAFVVRPRVRSRRRSYRCRRRARRIAGAAGDPARVPRSLTPTEPLPGDTTNAVSHHHRRQLSAARVADRPRQARRALSAARARHGALARCPRAPRRGAGRRDAARDPRQEDAGLDIVSD